MKTKKMIAIMASVMMIGSVAAACGDSNKETKTPHTTYSVDQINNMSDDELEKALENAAKEIEMSEKAGTKTEAPAEEIEEIDLWKDVKVTFSGAEGYLLASAEYIGDNQIIRDNVELWCDSTQKKSTCASRYSKYVNGFDEFYVIAKYDEEFLKEQGIVLKKARYEEPQKGKYEGIKENDFCFYTINGLGHKVEITEDTDNSVFKEVAGAVTEKIKTECADDPYFKWAKDKEIYPDRFFFRKDTGIDYGYISFLDKDGNFLAWVDICDFNYVQGDGKWIRDLWMEDGYIGVIETAEEMENDGRSYDGGDTFTERFKYDFYYEDNVVVPTVLVEIDIK